MYPAHRGQPPNRLGELLDQVRAEFEAQAHRSNDYDQQRRSHPLYSDEGGMRRLCSHDRSA